MPRQINSNHSAKKARDFFVPFGWILCVLLLVSFNKAEQLPVKTYTIADGLLRDVTREAFIESGNIEIIEANTSGVLTTLRPGEAPVLVTSAAIRPCVRSLVERFRSQTTVLSQAEIHPRARLKTVGSV